MKAFGALSIGLLSLVSLAQSALAAPCYGITSEQLRPTPENFPSKFCLPQDLDTIVSDGEADAEIKLLVDDRVVAMRHVLITRQDSSPAGPLYRLEGRGIRFEIQGEDGQGLFDGVKSVLELIHPIRADRDSRLFGSCDMSGRTDDEKCPLGGRPVAGSGIDGCQCMAFRTHQKLAP